jgi:hypothetical protein
MKETDGFDILVNGVPRTFRDTADIAYAAARNLKTRDRASEVTVRERATNKVATIMDDGRVT